MISVAYSRQKEKGEYMVVCVCVGFVVCVFVVGGVVS